MLKYYKCQSVLSGPSNQRRLYEQAQGSVLHHGCFGRGDPPGQLGFCRGRTINAQRKAISRNRAGKVPALGARIIPPD